MPPPPIVSVHPDDQLYTACAALVRTHARRLPLIDRDEQTGKETIVSVLTQYRVLKFLAINVSRLSSKLSRLILITHPECPCVQCRQECQQLTESIGVLGIGTYHSNFSPTGEPLTNKQPTPQSSHARRQRSRTYVPTTPQQAKPPGEQGTAQYEESTLAENAEDTVGVSKTTSEGDTPTAPGAFPHSRHASAAGQPPLHSHGSGSSDHSYSDRFHPLAVATLQTTVFDVVHLFSDLGISAVPIVDTETGQVINLYEAVDVVDLVRSNAYQLLDLTIEDALSRRSKDFPGVVTCTPEDSLASILAYIREKRVHRFVIVEGEETTQEGEYDSGPSDRPKKVPGRLVGVLCLSDILKYIVGASSLSGVKVVGLGFRTEEEGLAIPRVIDERELDEINEGVSGLGIS